MSKHTQGLWKVKGQSFDGKCILVDHQDGMIEVYGSNKEANAHFIAAAPETAAERDELKEAKRELVEALKECEEALSFLQDRNGMRVNPPTLENARAALAKHSKGE